MDIENKENVNGSEAELTIYNLLDECYKINELDI